jgi:hypothetical protein
MTLDFDTVFSTFSVMTCWVRVAGWGYRVRVRVRLEVTVRGYSYSCSCVLLFVSDAALLLSFSVSWACWDSLARLWRLTQQGGSARSDVLGCL